MFLQIVLLFVILVWRGWLSCCSVLVLVNEMLFPCRVGYCAKVVASVLCCNQSQAKSGLRVRIGAGRIDMLGASLPSATAPAYASASSFQGWPQCACMCAKCNVFSCWVTSVSCRIVVAN